MYPSQVTQIIVSSPIKGFKGFARLERNPRSSRKKREGVHCSMIKIVVVIVVKSPRQVASLGYLLYYAILSACLK